MDASKPSALRLAGFLCIAAGGLLLGIGSVMNWAVIGFAGSTALDSPIKGTDVWEGRATLAIAAAVLVGVIAMRLAGTAWIRRAIAIGIIVLGLFAAGLAIGDAIRVRSRFSGSQVELEKIARTLAQALGRPIADVLAQLQQRLDQIVAVNVGTGLWLVIAGGVLAAGGGGLSIAWANRQDQSRIGSLDADPAHRGDEGDHPSTV